MQMINAFKTQHKNKRHMHFLTSAPNFMGLSWPGLPEAPGATRSPVSCSRLVSRWSFSHVIMEFEPLLLSPSSVVYYANCGKQYH